MDATRKEDIVEILGAIGGDAEHNAFNAALHGLLFHALFPLWRSLDVKEQIVVIGNSLEPCPSISKERQDRRGSWRGS